MADPLRTTMRNRCDEIRQKIAARKGKPGFASNVEVLETTLAEMERLLAAEGEE
jgi:hypothetical protein